jgi:hypothetical protein
MGIAVSRSNSLSRKERHQRSRQTSCQTQTNQSGFNADTMPCCSCAAQFTIFRHKVRCDRCSDLFCEACTVMGKDSAERLCQACFVFSGSVVLKSQVSNLRVKDLLKYLRSRHISTQGCNTKKELLDLLPPAGIYVVDDTGPCPPAPTQNPVNENLPPTASQPQGAATGINDQQPSQSADASPSSSDSSPTAADASVCQVISDLHE